MIEREIVGTFDVLGIRFQVSKEPVYGSNPLRHCPKLRLDDENAHLMPLCHTFDSCWNRKFLSYVIERTGLGIEGATGFSFYNPPEYDPRPELRFDLSEGENGVVVHFFEDELEVSERFFVKVFLEAGKISIEHGLSRQKSAKEQLEKVELEFADILATLDS